MNQEVNTVSEYIEMNQKRQLVPGMIKNGKMMYRVSDKWVHKQVFEALYPKAVYSPLNEKGDNPCKKVNFIKDKKSY